MKMFMAAFAAILAFFFLPQMTFAQNVAAPNPALTKQWWNARYPGPAGPNPNAKKMPLISVKGNHFVDPQGNAVLFRGLSIADPDKIDGEGHWNKDFFVHVQQTGAHLIRIPVHPIAWRTRTPQGYLMLLDQAVDWCTDLGMYIDIDWHSIGNLHTGLFQDPMYQTSQQETFEFWRIIANHFAGNNTIAFYELFNEPTTFSNKLGPISWSDWKQINEDLIATIRAYDREKIPLVAGFDWAYDLTPLRTDPIQAEGIGYVTHPYPNKRPKPWEPKWEEDFGFAASQYPIIATEIGYWRRPGVPDDNYGPSIVNYLEGHGIGWLAWCYDPDWGRMFTSWDTFALSEEGEFFSKAMNAPMPATSPAPPHP
jgi:hypothetical protein